MKKEDIDKSQQGKLEELPGEKFVYQPGSIFFLGREPTPEEVEEEIEDRKKSGVCLRCEGTDFRTDEKGCVFCTTCGQKKL